MTHAHCNSELIKNKLKEKAKHIDTWQHMKQRESEI